MSPDISNFLEELSSLSHSILSLCFFALIAGEGCDRSTKRGREELPQVRGQGQKLGGPHARRAAAKRSYPMSEVGAAAESARLHGRGTAKRSHPASEARGGGREEQPHIQGAVAAQAQEGLRELSHVEGQEGRR